MTTTSWCKKRGIHPVHSHYVETILDKMTDDELATHVFCTSSGLDPTGRQGWDVIEQLYFKPEDGHPEMRSDDFEVMLHIAAQRLPRAT